MNDSLHFVLVIALTAACCCSVGGIAVVAALGHEPPTELSTVAWATASALAAKLTNPSQQGKQGTG